MKVRMLLIELGEDRISPRDVPKLRGYIAGKFPEFTELHNHTESNGFKYGYPMIQYKTLQGVPVVIGINEYAERLVEALYNIDEVDVGGRLIKVFEKAYKIKSYDLGSREGLGLYRFISPWMALNQENHRRYAGMSEQDRQELLKRILTGNILSMSKSLSYRVDTPINVLIKLEPVNVNFKSRQMLAFKGEFMTNFLIPDYLGIGKSVSRGFGTVLRAGEQEFK
ncbi:hypothetical protein DFR58_1118 [Anaerobacterium chartisolvens]|uniref:DNA repair protein n=1 Tax=Anaerobacterium chartisolvens TaxID=1297424 RepID=A0A369B4N8_9FIRM|nr:CRISPR-associated endonuclease Cas6 [Anaerobacterium chartisolvens]RCX16265.1 hypothetical protein DFR58_1118 [Anaerobacterium chartisolvens]